jgi:hypothetical protein
VAWLALAGCANPVSSFSAQSDHTADLITDRVQSVTPITVGRTLIGRFTGPSYIGFSMRASAGQGITAVLTTDDPGHSPMLEIYGPKRGDRARGQQVAHQSNLAGGRVALSYVFSNDGDYLIVATERPEGTGQYEFSLSSAGDGPAGPTVTCASLGKNCGSVLLPSGGTLDCGSCQAPFTCGGGGMANVCGQIASPNQPVAFTIPGFIVGPSKANQSDAANGVSSECTNWLAFMRNISGNNVTITSTSVDCSKQDQVGANEWLYVSNTSLSFTAQTPKGRLPRIVRGPQVAGTKGDRNAAYTSWWATCESTLPTIRGMFPGRYLTAFCPQPSNHAVDGQFQYASAVQVYLTPPDIDVAPVPLALTDVYMLSPTDSQTQQEAVTALQNACQSALGLLRDISVAQVVDPPSDFCRQGDQRGTSGWLYEGHATIQLQALLPLGQAITQADDAPAVTGMAASSENVALTSYWTSCLAGMQSVKNDARYKDVLVAAICNPPFVTGSTDQGNRQYHSTIMIYTEPPLLP